MHEGLPVVVLIAARGEGVQAVVAEEVALQFIGDTEREAIEATGQHGLVPQEAAGATAGRGVQQAAVQRGVELPEAHVAAQGLPKAVIALVDVEDGAGKIRLALLAIEQADAHRAQHLVAVLHHSCDVPVPVELHRAVALHHTEILGAPFVVGAHHHLLRAVRPGDGYGMAGPGADRQRRVVGIIDGTERVAVLVAYGHLAPRLGTRGKAMVRADRQHPFVPGRNEHAHRSLVALVDDGPVHRVRRYPAEHPSVGREFLLHVVALSRAHRAEGNAIACAVRIGAVAVHR